MDTTNNENTGIFIQELFCNPQIPQISEDFRKKKPVLKRIGIDEPASPHL